MSAAADKRVSVVTGGTGGIGRAVATRLARGGDRVVIVGRSEECGAEVLAALYKTGPGADHIFIAGDLSLLSETARVCEEIARRTERVDAVVCCAGILSAVPEWTSEGLERSFVLNYLTRYLLVRRLLPPLAESPSGRVVLVANAGRYEDTLDFDDLQHRHGEPGLQVAGRTQFANDLFATELADRLGGTRVEATCVYPGLVKTGVFRNARGVSPIVRALATAVQCVAAMSPDAAAETPAFLAQDPRAMGVAGRFYGPRCAPRQVPARALRPARRAALWTASEELVRPYLGSSAAPGSWRAASRPL